MNCFMGIDIGTSGCKALVFDESGQQLSESSRSYEIISKKNGWAELDTSEVISKCFEVIRESASNTEEGIIAALGISSQGEAFTMIDEIGNPLCNAFVSSDIRSNELIKPWTERFGEEKLYRITGHTPHPMFSLFKLLWVKENMPEIWKKAFRILCFEDLLQYRLGIKNPSMGWPLAGRTMLFDVIKHSWNDEILNNLGLDKKKLSEPLKSGKSAGFVREDIAKQLNLGDKTLIVTGGHDQTCSALGAGVTSTGTAAYSSGTVECITSAFNNPVFTDELHKNNLCTYDFTLPGMYSTVAFSLTGGNLLKWFMDQFGAAEAELAANINSDPYELLLNQIPDEPSGLLVLPYFTPSGTPYFDVSVKGAIMGMDLSVKRGEILKALLEGVAFEIKLNLDILKRSGYEIKELRLIGGGTKSEKLVRLKTDVIGTPITILDIREAGCMGAAILAKAAYSGIDPRKIAEDWIRPVARIEPKDTDYYNIKFESYKKLYPALKELNL
ncbi:MAG TPA: FGGY-family carbohydrate kinase [Bacteroidales bacterium]|nr:FGGY-family carbohydrate kinase [Bacteroidales bacterium]